MSIRQVPEEDAPPKRRRRKAKGQERLVPVMPTFVDDEVPEPPPEYDTRVHQPPRTDTMPLDEYLMLSKRLDELEELIVVTLCKQYWQDARTGLGKEEQVLDALGWAFKKLRKG